jgi:aspartate aminotransferase-like enzyme
VSDSTVIVDMSAGGTRWTGRFFLPGPTEVRDEVLLAQAQPMIGHRGAAFETLVTGMDAGLRMMFRTARPVYIASCSATGLMEAAIRNAARARVLSLVNGAFSERFFHIARACGLHAESLEVPPGEAHTPEMVAAALARGASDGGAFDGVTIVHSETSTGVLAPLREIAQVVHASGDAMLLVDGVTSVAGAPVETDAWSLDVVLTGSQKALALPPGLALGVAQAPVLERARAKRDRGVYFDFLEFEKYAAKSQTPSTPAISLFYALAEQVARITLETVEARWARHAAMARRTWAWADEMRSRGVEVRVLAPEGYRSPTVSCLTIPEGRTGSEIDAAMRRRGFVISAGYGPLRERTIRIGHMGDHTLDELEALLAELDAVLSG